MVFWNPDVRGAEHRGDAVQQGQDGRLQEQDEGGVGVRDQSDILMMKIPLFKVVCTYHPGSMITSYTSGCTKPKERCLHPSTDLGGQEQPKPRYGQC